MDYEDEQARPVTPEEYVLRRLIVQYCDDTLDGHRWLWEKDRWNELVFSILAWSGKVSESDARRVTHEMEALDLIGIGTLAHAHETRVASKASITLERITELLEDAGCAPEEGRKIATAIAEAASYFHKNHQGKVQVLFRRLGEAMIDELQRDINFSGLSSVEAEHALVYWLQNVLNLPLSLKDDAVIEFAAEHSLAPERLIDAADSIGLNLAFLDDLIYSRKHRNRENEEARRHGSL